MIKCRDIECERYAKLIGIIPEDFYRGMEYIELYYYDRLDQCRFLFKPMDNHELELEPGYEDERTEDTNTCSCCYHDPHPNLILDGFGCKDERRDIKYWWFFDLKKMESCHHESEPILPEYYNTIGNFIKWLVNKMGGVQNLRQGRFDISKNDRFPKSSY